MEKQPQAGMTRLASWVAYFYESNATEKPKPHDVSRGHMRQGIPVRENTLHQVASGTVGVEPTSWNRRSMQSPVRHGATMLAWTLQHG